MKEAGGAAVGQRELRDALGRQVKIEIGKRVHLRTSQAGKRKNGGRPAPCTTMRTRLHPAHAVQYRRCCATANLYFTLAPEKRLNMPVVKPTIKPKAVKKAVTPEAKLAKLGLHTDMDLVLHLPMRYEDETQVVTIRDASMRGGESSQVEGIVVKNEISYKPRKQLLVHIADETGDLQLRFMNFYGSQVKQLAEGTRVRARGELKHGFFGAEMVHPTY